MTVEDNHNHFCIYCGAKIEPNQHFCIQCGKEIYHDPQEEVVKVPSKYKPEIDKIEEEYEKSEYAFSDIEKDRNPCYLTDIFRDELCDDLNDESRSKDEKSDRKKDTDDCGDGHHEIEVSVREFIKAGFLLAFLLGIRLTFF